MVMRRVCLWIILMTIASAAALAQERSPVREPSAVAVPDFAASSKLLLDERGALLTYTADEAAGQLLAHTSDDGTRWSVQAQPLEGPLYASGAIFFEDEGRKSALWLKRRCEGDCRKHAVNLFYDITLSTRDEAGVWRETQTLHRGYVGAIRQIVRNAAGDWLLPFAEWVPNLKVGPPTGSHVIRLLAGNAKSGWRLVPADLTTPVPERAHAPGFGGIEPAIARLGDGRFLMLIRTQTQFLYQSFSPDGLSWSPAERSPLQGSSAPAYLLSLRDGRVVALWNNQHQRSAYRGRYVYSGRDALHAAISDDGARTWRGLREVYRDPLLVSPPPPRDFGTAYPTAVEQADGTIRVLTGQGPGRHALIAFSPSFLEQTCAAADEAARAVIAFREFGPIVRHKRERSLLSKRGAGSGEVDMDLLADGGAVQWNFPAALAGELSFEIRQRYVGSLTVSLTDRLATPGDPDVETFRSMAVEVPAPIDDAWRKVSLSWDHSSGTEPRRPSNHVYLAGQGTGTFELRNLRMCGRR